MLTFTIFKLIILEVFSINQKSKQESTEKRTQQGKTLDALSRNTSNFHDNLLNRSGATTVIINREHNPHWNEEVLCSTKPENEF